MKDSKLVVPDDDDKEQKTQLTPTKRNKKKKKKVENPAETILPSPEVDNSVESEVHTATDKPQGSLPYFLRCFIYIMPLMVWRGCFFLFYVFPPWFGLPLLRSWHVFFVLLLALGCAARHETLCLC